jgi:predicted alpha/beta hydrolase family esterase
LAERLRDRGHQGLYPALPDPDAPRYELWKEALRRQLALMEGEQRVAVCHSLACLLWFRTASVLGREERVDRLLLVSPPASESVPDAGASFRIESLDAQAIRASVEGEIRIVCSDADPYNPAGAQALYGNPLGVRADVVPGAGHITPESGYGPWPAIESWCLGQPCTASSAPAKAPLSPARAAASASRSHERQSTKEPAP